MVLVNASSSNAVRDYMKREANLPIETNLQLSKLAGEMSDQAGFLGDPVCVSLRSWSNRRDESCRLLISIGRKVFRVYGEKSPLAVFQQDR